MCKKGLILLGLAAAIWIGAPVLADEVVHFTNGTTMAVRSHEVEEGTITLNLGKDSYMSFPMSLVDRIEKSGQAVYRSGATANRMVDGPNRGAGMTGIRPPRYRDGRGGATVRPDGEVDENPSIIQTSSGLTAYRPFAKSGHRAKSQVELTGHMAVVGGASQDPDTGRGYVSKRRIGGLTGTDPSRKPPAMALAPSSSAPPPPKPKPDDNSNE